MRLPPLKRGRILKRYKRFLADIECEDGIITAHCPNTGAMTSCWEPGAPAEISHSDNPKRKLAWTLERIDMGAGWVGVNTARVNAVVAEGINAGRVPVLGEFEQLSSEPSFNTATHGRSRFDLKLEKRGASAFVEVKNATLYQQGVVRFPDAVSTRALKHLELLETAVSEGHEGWLLFAINRPETMAFEPAVDIHPAYGSRLYQVMENGVRVIIARIDHYADGLELGENREWTG